MPQTPRVYVLKQKARPKQRAWPTWERWTIDEIADGHVRVLAAGARDELALRALTRTEAADARATADDVRSLVMEAELSRDRTVWGEEAENFFEEGTLATFLNRRREGKAGLPAGRPLREGDVFYVEIPASHFTFTSMTRGEINSVEGEALLSTYEQWGVEVWDVTAAARQASKLAYHRALAASPEEVRG